MTFHDDCPDAPSLNECLNPGPSFSLAERPSVRDLSSTVYKGTVWARIITLSTWWSFGVPF